MNFPTLNKKIIRMLNDLLRLTNRSSQPNINELWRLVKDVEIIKLNIKNFGYDLGARLLPVLENMNTESQPGVINLVSKPTTQSDVESPWFKYWCDELKTAPIYHRKLWEFAFFLQCLYDHGLLIRGSKGLGFGCGREPLASYFASKGLTVKITDLPTEKSAGLGWTETGQHASSLSQAYFPDLVSEADFNKHVSHQFVDMNDIPDFQDEFDFCWSVCAMEHLGSIEQGLAFVENSLQTIRPGGLAVHTTEFNFLSEVETIDNWPTVLFRKSDIEKLYADLSAKGHTMLGPDFHCGTGMLDKYIDLPPYLPDEGEPSPGAYMDTNLKAHLKLSVDGFASTCFGIIIRKKE